MEILGQALEYATQRSDQFSKALVEHLQLSFFALGIAVLICLPLGIFTSRFGRVAQVIINIFGVIRVIPSLAVLIVLLPVMGVGFPPALVALIILACPPILINTDAGMREVPEVTLEAARGMGMSAADSLWRVQIPLALPVILGGIRTAALEVIASAALAAFIGAGGLGDFIVQGLSGNQTYVLLVGAVPIALLALLVEFVLASIQRAITPRTQSRLQTV
jgi:osmoprotectant transport system permease protein